MHHGEGTTCGSADTKRMEKSLQAMYDTFKARYLQCSHTFLVSRTIAMQRCSAIVDVKTTEHKTTVLPNTIVSA